MGILGNYGLFRNYGNYKTAGNIEENVKIGIAVIISNFQILDMYMKND